MEVTEKIDAAFANVKAAIAKERAQVLEAVQVAVLPLTAQITDLKDAIAALKLQVEAGSEAQATLADLEATVVANLEQVAADVDSIVADAPVE